MKKLSDLIVERFGKFSNVDNIADKIENEIKKRYEFNILKDSFVVDIGDLSGDNCFSKVRINLNTNGENSYVYDINDIEKDEPTINFDFSNGCDKELIIHELTHAYRNFMLWHNVRKTIDTSKYVEYNKFVNMNSLNKLLYNVRSNERDKYKLFALELAYICNSEEIGAYNANIENSVKQIIKTNNYTSTNFDYKKFFNELINNNLVVYIYKHIYDVYQDIAKGTLSNEDKQAYLYEFKIFNKDATFEYMTKYVERHINKIEKVLFIMIPKIVCEYVFNK